jgi:SSS family solute:Na+ symporter
MSPRVFLWLALTASVVHAGEWPRELRAWRGSTPQIDGELSAGEWTDAACFEGVRGWTHQFSPTIDAADLAVKGWVKFDDEALYFAFEVTDDVLYGIDTPRWLPAQHPAAHELTRDGWPWFGDGIELLINATHHWQSDEHAAGDGSSWQMVFNLTKSRLGGIGVPGLMEGEPRSKESAWNTYRRWIETGAMKTAALIRPGGRGYTMEWSVRFDPCLEISPGVPFRPQDRETVMGLNIALCDTDTQAAGSGNFGDIHHEDWFAGERETRTQLRQWGILRFMPGKKPSAPISVVPETHPLPTTTR